jgi:hypothetical protein
MLDFRAEIQHVSGPSPERGDQNGVVERRCPLLRPPSESGLRSGRRLSDHSSSPPRAVMHISHCHQGHRGEHQSPACGPRPIRQPATGQGADGAQPEPTRESDPLRVAKPASVKRSEPAHSGHDEDAERDESEPSNAADSANWRCNLRSYGHVDPSGGSTERRSAGRDLLSLRPASLLSPAGFTIHAAES